MFVETGERRSLWHKYVSIAVLNYNTSLRASIDCEPSRVFSRRISYNVPHFRMGIFPQKICTSKSQIAPDVYEQTKMSFQYVSKSAMQADTKYKGLYDKKADALKLKAADYVYVSQPQAHHRGSKVPFPEFR